MNKRGVSPLLAAVLLVAFAITLGAIVSNYVINKAREFDPEKIAEASILCESVSLGYTADENLHLEDQGGGISTLEPVTIINRGSFSIHKLIITAPGQVSQTYPINTPLKYIAPGDSNNEYNISIGLDPASSDKRIKIVPVINDREKNKFVQCAERQIVFDWSQLCMDIGKDEQCQ